jgi:hypothetical protein
VGGCGVGYDAFLTSRRAPSVVGLFAAICAAGTAHAQATSSLSWTRLPGAESCIGAGELARRVEQRLGRAALVAPSQADRSVEAHVEPRRGGGWQASLALADRSGAILRERALETRETSCRALDQALVLVVALLVDPEGAPRPPPPEPAPRVVIREVVRTVRVREPWSMAAAGGASVEAGVLPEPALAASLALAVDPPGLPVAELAGFASLEGEEDAALAGRGAALRVFGASAAVCPRLLDWLRACGAARLAWLRWRGDGFEEVGSGSAVVPALGAAARGELPLGGPFTAVAAAGAWLPLRRVSVRYELSASVAGDPAGGSELLYRAAAASVWAGVGVAVRFF